MTQEIYILGMHTPTLEELDVNKTKVPLVEVWGINILYKIFRKGVRYSKWFDFHGPLVWTKEHTDWLINCPIPIVMQRRFTEITNSMPYPTEAVIKGFDSAFLNNTAALMLAYALVLRNVSGSTLQTLQTIHIYGVDLRERKDELLGVRYMIARARQIGLAVEIAPSSYLTYPIPIYCSEVHG